MHRLLLVVALLSSAPALAAEMEIKRNLAYTEPADSQRRLDVYSPTDGREHPIAIWIHGGGWKKGDKAAVQEKSQAFVDRDFVFISVNYRFVPDVTVEEMTQDVARAIRWSYDHARDVGGSPDAISVLGHSAGAHLAALVCTDESYLTAEGLSLRNIRGCVPVDTAAYDVPSQLATIPVIRQATYKSVFGATAAVQRPRSPMSHVASGKNIPPFLLLHVADRVDSTLQSKAFANALTKAGTAATVFAAEGKNHGSINRELGLSDDPPTKAMFAFLTCNTTSTFSNVACEGTYRHHLQGICTDERDSIYWSFTTTLVKTNSKGRVQKQIEVGNHHGDLCQHEGKLYVAVNFGRFNDPEGNADSWVYVYDADDLSLLAKHETQEVFHGAGGIGWRDDRFFVVGGLPDDVPENYVYEYDADFKFVRKHIVASGHTHLGIQTAAFAHDRWWFGCYGDPKILLVTDADFKVIGKYKFDCSLGIVGVAGGRLLSASGTCQKEQGCDGLARLVGPSDDDGLSILSAALPEADE